MDKLPEIQAGARSMGETNVLVPCPPWRTSAHCSVLPWISGGLRGFGLDW